MEVWRPGGLGGTGKQASGKPRDTPGCKTDAAEDRPRFLTKTILGSGCLVWVLFQVKVTFRAGQG